MHRGQGQSHCASNIISNPHPFHSKWVKPPLPQLQQFQYFTLKIQGQGHGWGQSLKSQCESNILWTHIPFVPCQSPIPFLRYNFFKIWPWKSKVKVMEEVNIESRNMGPKIISRETENLFTPVNPSQTWQAKMGNNFAVFVAKSWPWRYMYRPRYKINVTQIRSKDITQTHLLMLVITCAKYSIPLELELKYVKYKYFWRSASRDYVPCGIMSILCTLLHKMATIDLYILNSYINANHSIFIYWYFKECRMALLD